MWTRAVSASVLRFACTAARTVRCFYARVERRLDDRALPQLRNRSARTLLLVVRSGPQAPASAKRSLLRHVREGRCTRRSTVRRDAGRGRRSGGSIVTAAKFRRVKVLFYIYGGKGARAWREPHERYAWVPLEEAGSERVTITFADVGEQQCT